MRATYDEAEDILTLSNGQPDAVSASFLRGPDGALHLGTEEGHDVVGFILLGASAYLPCARGTACDYDANADVLTIGEAVEDPALVTENGDFVGYWARDEADPDGVRHPVGVAVRRASVNLGKVVKALPA